MTREGKPITVALMKAADVRIEYHVLIRHEANPYDPSWERYYEARLQRRWRGTLLGRLTIDRIAAPSKRAVRGVRRVIRGTWRMASASSTMACKRR